MEKIRTPLGADQEKVGGYFMSRRIPDTSVPPSADKTFLKLKKELRASIDRADTAAIITAVMKLGEHGNSHESDWKMSPRTFYEFADVLRLMKDAGQITDTGQAQIIELLRGS
jgi:hypothetical protein